MTDADLAFLGGSVLTMDAARSTASAVAVGQGRILAVGTDADVAPLVGARTRKIALGGRTLLPSFGDAHVHPSSAGVKMMRCPLDELPPSLDGYLDAIAGYAAQHPDKEWIVGSGWYMAAFPGGTPSRHDLDRVVPGRPAFFTDRDGHRAWLNSPALECVGYTRDAADPPDGRIEREADDMPAGTVHEGAMERARGFLPETTVEEVVEGIRLAQAYLNRLGITSFQDAWVEPLELEAYRVLAERGQLSARVVAAHWWERAQGLEQIDSILERRERGTLGRLAADTVKIMVDGVAENFTAAMLHPYLDATGAPTENRGLTFLDPPLLNEAVTRLDALGFQVHFHALGDRAVRIALDAVAAARHANGANDHRHHLAHLQIVDPVDIPRFAELGAVANIQPYWACHDAQMDEFTIPFLPPERIGLQYPFASLSRAGATLAGGSDWTVSTPNVMLEVETAVNRVSPDDRAAPALVPAESLTIVQALAAYTGGAAYVNHLETVCGSIEVNKSADLVVLDRDVLDAAAGPIGDTTVAITMLEGDVLHDAIGLGTIDSKVV
jgi:predicted amidohydrolase YtcJ